MMMILPSSQPEEGRPKIAHNPYKKTKLNRTEEAEEEMSVRSKNDDSDVEVVDLSKANDISNCFH